MTMTPNKSPEPTAIGRFSLFHKIRVRRVAVTRWLSFLRSAAGSRRIVDEGFPANKRVHRAMLDDALNPFLET